MCLPGQLTPGIPALGMCNVCRCTCISVVVCNPLVYMYMYVTKILRVGASFLTKMTVFAYRTSNDWKLVDQSR